jgi:hypothetical protein
LAQSSKPVCSYLALTALGRVLDGLHLVLQLLVPHPEHLQKEKTTTPHGARVSSGEFER